MPRTNMYKLAIKRWNPFRGCEHECRYCVPSFQSWYRRFWRQFWKPNKEEKGCEKCRDWIPHEHPEDLTKRLPKTGFMQFIFTVASGDISSCPTEYFKRIINRIKQEPHKTFLIQSKNPETFGRVSFPDNVILGTTIETNRDKLYEVISKAPKPSKRYEDFLKIKHPLKMVTIEPVIDFDLEEMIAWMKNLNPCMIWIGYDSKNNRLPEPELAKVKELHWELSKDFVVILKTIRKAWDEVNATF